MRSGSEYVGKLAFIYCVIEFGVPYGGRRGLRSKNGEVSGFYKFT